ncbi:hypothetical protein NKG94_34170 [Micromonospora sp. M12]
MSRIPGWTVRVTGCRRWSWGRCVPGGCETSCTGDPRASTAPGDGAGAGRRVDQRRGAGPDARQRRPATVLVGLGTVSAVPAAIAGLNDWAALARDQRRVGLVHAAANTVGLTLYAGSLAARLSGRHGVGRALGFLGLSTVSLGAYIGATSRTSRGPGQPERLRVAPDDRRLALAGRHGDVAATHPDHPRGGRRHLGDPLPAR